MKANKIPELIGITFSKVTNIDNEELVFEASNGYKVRFYHLQDCCEYVRIEDIDGDLNDLVDSPILMAEVVTNSDDDFGLIEYIESFTWTFYKFATIKGSVVVRWLGESNGYYSEDVYMDVEDDKPSKPDRLDDFLKDAFSN